MGGLTGEGWTWSREGEAIAESNMIDERLWGVKLRVARIKFLGTIEETITIGVDEGFLSLRDRDDCDHSSPRIGKVGNGSDMWGWRASLDLAKGIPNLIGKPLRCNNATIGEE